MVACICCLREGKLFSHISKAFCFHADHVARSLREGLKNEFYHLEGEVSILYGGAIILYSMASILSNVPEILHVQHQFFEIYLSVLGFSKGKIHFFPKVLKKWSSCKKWLSLFRGGGSEPKGNNFTFFSFFLNPSLIQESIQLK